MSKVEEIAKRNDLLRTTFMTGKVLLTHGVQNSVDKEEIITAVREFNDFNDDNDPYKEHDCATFEVNKSKYIFKIDYYDKNYEYGIDPHEEPEKVHRVLTIMCASEY